MNAARHTRGDAAWCPRRDESYLGVLVDDLITRGVSEPYRMFTSRAEYRLSLREDNADLRLTEIGREMGLVDDARWAAFSAKREAIDLEQQRLRALRVNPLKIASELIESALGKPLEREATAYELLRRPDTTHAGLQTLVEQSGLGEAVTLAPAVVEQVEIQAKYQGYIDRQRDEVARQAAYETLALPEALDYTEVIGLSREVCQKLQTHRPQTLGQAARIQGVTPAAIGLLLVHLKRIGVALGAVL